MEQEQKRKEKEKQYAFTKPGEDHGDVKERRRDRSDSS